MVSVQTFAFSELTQFTYQGQAVRLHVLFECNTVVQSDLSL